MKKSSSRSGNGRRSRSSKSNGSKRSGTLAAKKVGRATNEMKEGKLRSGRSKKRVSSRKQAVAIGLSEARRAGGKVPQRRSASR